MNRILITGAAGFIGSALCRKLSSNNEVIGVFHRKRPVDHAKITWEQADLTDYDAVTAICKKYSPDVVIHCAGIAHQKIHPQIPQIYADYERTYKIIGAANSRIILCKEARL